MDINDIRKNLDSVKNDLLKKSGVVSIGIGYKKVNGIKTDKLSVICSVEQKKPIATIQEKDLVPQEIQGIPTDVVQSGVIKAFGVYDTVRPALGGDSIGHYAITAGTLGCVVKKNGQRMILSNNHVMANSNEAKVGDQILKPGAYDGGKLENQIASLDSWQNIVFIGEGLPDTNCSIANGLAMILNVFSAMLGRQSRMRAYSLQAEVNLIDAALAKPIVNLDVSDEIRDIGKIANMKSAELGMEVHKRGRTTGYTKGIVDQIDVTTQVSYGTNKTAVFSDQVIITSDNGSFSQPGDSGSAILSGNNLVGLLFAGSDTITIVNRIENVFNILGCSL